MIYLPSWNIRKKSVHFFWWLGPNATKQDIDFDFIKVRYYNTKGNWVIYPSEGGTLECNESGCLWITIHDKVSTIECNNN